VATQTLTVLMNGRRIGVLVSKAQRHVELRYDEDAADDPAAVPLSVSMPLAGRRYRGAVLDNWLQGLLPDRSEVLQRWRRDFGIRRLDVFALLWHLGEDVAGAAQFVRPDRLGANSEPGTLSPVTVEHVAERLRVLRTDQTAWGPSPRTGQFSLAGTQAKFALYLDPDGGWAEPAGAIPTTHILKPAIPTMVDQDVSEHLTMRTAALLGFAVPPTVLTTFGAERALVVQRFDRVRTPSGWLRVHQEDMCQALGVAPADKYEAHGGPGVARITALLREAVGLAHRDEDVFEFVRAVAFNWLIVGSDAHAKNYALLHAPGQSRLAPLYDLNSLLTYRDERPVSLSLRMGTWHTGADDVRAADWAAVARQVGLQPDGLLVAVRRMAERLPDAASAAATATHVASALPPMFVDAVAARAKACLGWLDESR
jgi:serine/threonine-protein kinase HipA